MTFKEFTVQLALGTLSFDDRLTLAKSKRTSRKTLTILSKDKSYNVRCWVAVNLNTPKEVLRKLSKDKDSYVKYWATKNLQ